MTTGMEAQRASGMGVHDAATGSRLGKAMIGTMILAIIPAGIVPLVQGKNAVLASHPGLVALVGALAMAIAGIVPWLLVRRYDPGNPYRWYLVFFTVFTFTAWIDLFIAFTRLGWTTLMNFYFEKGEPYLATSHGFAINLWDGTTQLGLYLAMAWYLSHRQVPQRLGMFWVGSIMTATINYMIGNVVGPFAEMIEPSILLNLIFMLVPVCFAALVMHQEALATPGRPLTIVLRLATLALAALAIFRAAAVLGPDAPFAHDWARVVDPYALDPSRYLEIQIVALGLYLVPFSLFIAYVRGPMSPALGHIAWFMAGFTAQAAFAHLAGSLFRDGWDGVHVAMWLVALALMTLPLTLALRIAPPRPRQG